MVVVLLIIGFPTLIIFSWIYDVTPEGIEKTDRYKPSVRTNYSTILLLLVVIGGLIFYFQDKLFKSKINPNSVAVLPFDNYSPKSEDEYLSDGFTEVIIANLAKVKDIMVISRTSVMRYKDTDMSWKEIADELNVSKILEGSIQKKGNKIRVVGQLIEASTNNHLWAETYDEDIDDIFAIQTSIAKEIAASLKLTITEPERSVIEDVLTDNEWVYEVLLSDNGEILSEIFQGASHITTNFKGSKIGRHPILKNATLNCNFTDVGISDYKFFLSPVYTASEGYTREIIMDENPWTYRIMAEELINEDRYEEPGNPETVIISDVKNYLYIEYEGSTSGQNISLEIYVSFIGSCGIYVHHHNYPEFSYGYGGGTHRTSIELPEDFNPSEVYELGFVSSGNDVYTLIISSISRLFYLDEDYMPSDLDIDFTPFSISNSDPEKWLRLNENTENLDCLGTTDGSALCDDCGICNGENINMDDCGICFGNNQNMDCNNICFGISSEDECGICDDNPENDNSICSGCTDINAENFDENAVFDDGNCTYSDHTFYVPNEYTAIQSAIFYANSGDTVEVGPGIYEENIDFMNKPLTVRSQYENGLAISEFVISSVDSASTITIENISAGGALIGFTITNGYGHGASFEDFISMAADEELLDSLLSHVIRAGGISVSNASPYLKDLHITNNTARNVGGGIGLINSNAIIESCQISNNTIPDGDALGGGGIAINGGHPILIDVTIDQNYVGSNMYFLNGGGGILCGFSFGDNILQLDLENVSIIGNTANIGAGIGALSGIIKGNHLLIVDNIGTYGAAISLGEPLGLVIGNISLSIKSSTIAHNTGLSGVGMINTAQMNAVNTIFWENGDAEIFPLPNNDQLNLDINFCDVKDEWLGIGNINLNPLFKDAANSNYTLDQLSPCIDVGTADTNMDGSNDIETFNGTNPDMGAFEFECGADLGDVSGEGIINILDLVQMSNYVLEISIPTYACASDFNHDGDVNILDIVGIVNYILDN